MVWNIAHLTLLFLHDIFYPHLDFLCNALAMSNAKSVIHSILIDQHNRL
jgi:hypothetical protein